MTQPTPKAARKKRPVAKMTLQHRRSPEHPWEDLVEHDDSTPIAAHLRIFVSRANLNSQERYGRYHYQIVDRTYDGDTEELLSEKTSYTKP